jgi:hypothetical protein
MGPINEELRRRNELDAARRRVRELERQLNLEGIVDQTPSVGRVVHYVAYGTPGGEFPAGVCRAAIVTEVGIPLPLASTQPDLDHRIGICVLNPTGLFFNRGIPYDAEKKPGTWHWPERV